jgi:hypothetical protein
MCCFSGPITRVSGTSIFARLEGERQSLAYQMRLASVDDVAMILPLPIAPGYDDRAVEFVNLTETPQLFHELGQCFRPPPTRALDLAAVAGAAPSLAVHRVGAYDASFVPAIADFARLDPRFRLPDAVLGRVPAYADYGFAVFQLRKVVSLGNILRRDPTHGIVERKWPLFRRQINGIRPNTDTWAEPI